MRDMQQIIHGELVNPSLKVQGWAGQEWHSSWAACTLQGGRKWSAREVPPAVPPLRMPWVPMVALFRFSGPEECF